MQWARIPFAKWLLLAAIAAASGCAGVFEEDGASAVVPYRIGDKGQIIVEANINDQGPFDFALDTGASISVIFDETCDKCQLERRDSRRVLIQGMVGSGEFPTTKIDRLNIGGITWVGARTAVMPGDTISGAEIDGILGVDILGNYAIGYSVKERVIRFYPPELVSERSYKGWSSIPLRELKTGVGDTTLHTIDLEISGNEIMALFDLGAGPNMMNWRALRFIGVPLRKQRRENKVSGAVESTSIDAELHVDVVKTANLYWRNKTFLVADIHILDVLQLDHRPIAIVGVGLFNQRDFVIDYARGRLLVRTSD